MLPRSQLYLSSACVLALAACSDDDHTSQIVGPAANDGSVSAPPDAGSADASGASAGCSGQDAISQLLCQLGLGGTGADAGLGGLTDIINSLGGFAGLGGAFGGGTMPTAAQCANASDQFTRFLCSLGRDGGLGPMGRGDGGAAPPPIDAGAPEDAGTSAQDSGVVSQDAELVDSGANEDASSSDAGELQDAGDSGQDDAGADGDSSTADGSSADAVSG